MNARLLMRIICLAAGAALLAGCSTTIFDSNANTVTGSGHVVTEPRTAGAFTALEVNGPLQVVFQPGAESVTVTADDNIVPLIQTWTSSGTLHVGFVDNTSIRNSTDSPFTSPGRRSLRPPVGQQRT